jgi:hypothetical protein
LWDYRKKQEWLTGLGNFIQNDVRELDFCAAKDFAIPAYANVVQTTSALLMICSWRWKYNNAHLIALIVLLRRPTSLTQAVDDVIDKAFVNHVFWGESLGAVLLVMAEQNTIIIEGLINLCKRPMRLSAPILAKSAVFSLASSESGFSFIHASIRRWSAEFSTASSAVA